MSIASIRIFLHWSGENISGHLIISDPLHMNLKNFILEIKFKTKLGRILAVAITKIQDIMIKRMNHVSDKIIEYQREVINSLLTFDILQANLTLAHIQNCCFEDFEYVYKQALSIKEVRWLFS